MDILRNKYAYLVALLMMLFSSLSYADCQLIAPQHQTLEQPVEVAPGIIDLQFRCQLPHAKVLSFPLDALSRPEIYADDSVDITVLSSARAAYLLPEGLYQFTLTVESDHDSAVSMALRDLHVFQQENNLHILTISAFGGFCIALCIYVGVLGRSLHNAGFYAYSGYILSAGFFFILQESLLRLLMPDVHWLHSHELKSIFAGATVFTAVRFICLLLDLRLILKQWEYQTIINCGLLVLVLGFISALPVEPLHLLASQLMGPITLIGMVAITVATAYAALRKIHGAGWVLIALIVLLAAMLFRVYLPHVSEFLTRYALIIAVTAEALLLAIAASERVKRLQADKMQAYLAASSDPLCPVLNRRGWEASANEMLSAHKKRGGVILLLFIDLDGFKHINDTYGHRVGDEALIILAKILNSQSRAQDIVGRLGGDEFVVMSHCHNRSIAERVTKRISERLTDLSLKIDEKIIEVSASVGAQIIDAPHSDLSLLLHEADMLMYEKKHATASL
ncbi:sensor domain-containing diguanylate cyclase [Alteromonas lipolytica]|nr:GGDEF domain-containing protein [Alteromonas lipolytica]